MKQRKVLIRLGDWGGGSTVIKNGRLALKIQYCVYVGHLDRNFQKYLIVSQLL